MVCEDYRDETNPLDTAEYNVGVQEARRCFVVEGTELVCNDGEVW